MSETLPPQAQRWAKSLQDAIATDSAIREGLQDDDAVPFIAWGRAQAERIAARWVAAGITPDEEQLDEAAGALMDLMTNINWAVRYRHKKGTAWVVNILRSLNALSRDLLGENAPTLGEETIAAWVAERVQQPDSQVLRELMAQLTPAEKPPTAPPLPGRPPFGAASALGHVETPHDQDQAENGTPAGLLGQPPETTEENAPPTLLEEALGQVGAPPAPQSLGDMLGHMLGSKRQRALHDIADDPEDTQNPPSTANSATAPGEDHDQAQ